MMTRFVVCPVHVGREQEIAALTESAAAAKDRGGTLLIAGDAGVGKTRLAAEAIRIGGEQDFLLLTGQCVERATAAYAPLATALRRHLRTLDGDALRSCFAGVAALAATLLPEVATDLALPSPAPGAPPEHLDAAVFQLLAHLTRSSPALLLLEDLHWAAPDMLRMLVSLICESAELPLWIVGTYRTDELTRRHPLTPVLVELTRQRRHEELRLEPLGREQARAMVRATLGDVDVGDDVVEAVVERTEGNPLFVEELCRVVLEACGDRLRTALAADELRAMALPLTIRETLIGRVTRLDPRYAQALRVAAVAGHRVDPALVKATAGLDDDTLRSVIVEALEHQLLVEHRDGAVRTYAFRHELTREALVSELIGPQRQAAHGQVAQALLDLHGDTLDEVAGTLADHLLEAGDMMQAGAMAVHAARQAVRIRALDEAAQRYAQSLRLMNADHPERLSLLVEAAEAVLTPTHLDAAVSFASEARDLAHAHGDAVAEARAVAAQAYERMWRGDINAFDLFRAVLQLTTGRGDRWEVWALGQLARRLGERGDAEEGRGLLQRALQLAAQLPQSRLVAGLHNARGILGAHISERIDAFDEAIAQAEATEAHAERALALTHRAYCAMYQGRFREARSWLERLRNTAAPIVPYYAVIAPMVEALLACLGGEYDVVETILVDQRPPADVLIRISRLSTSIEMYLRHGEQAAGRAAAAELLSMARITHRRAEIVWALSSAARVRLVNDGIAVARPLFVEALQVARERGAPYLHWWFSPDFARGLLADGERGELDDWVAILRRMTEPGDGQSVVALRFCEGLLAVADGRYSEGTTWLHDAAQGYRDMPFPARQAEVWLALAELEWRAGHQAESVAAARTAHDIAARIGSPPLLAEAVAALRRTGHRVTVERVRAPCHGGLSSREVQIACLVAAGCSNAEIGKRLFLSGHTVRNHVSNILGKLELRRRVDVARWVTEQGLEARERS